MVGLGALAVPACAAQSAPSLGENPSWADVRAQFKLTRERIHMAGFLLASHPRPVADAIERHRADCQLPECFTNSTSNDGAHVLRPSFEITADSRTPLPSAFQVMRWWTVRPSWRCTSPSRISAPALRLP
jgi:hypothetical protein